MLSLTDVQLISPILKGCFTRRLQKTHEKFQKKGFWLKYKPYLRRPKFGMLC